MSERDERLFGIDLFRKKAPKDEQQDPTSFAPEVNNDGAVVIDNGPMTSPGAFTAYALDIAGSLKNEMELIKKYRRIAYIPEADQAIDDICNDSIVTLDDQPIVEIYQKNTDLSKNIQSKIEKEFEYIYKLLRFERDGWEVFRQWYVDGRLYYHKMIDKKNPSKGIVKLKRIDPLYLKKVRELHKEPHPENNNVQVVKKISEYYVFNEKGLHGDVGSYGIKIAPESITFVHSGKVDEQGQIIVGHLHKAIRPLNQLRMVEDAAVIYRISRAPERRVFYIDVGQLPTVKAEQYVRDIMNRYKNRIIYDASTGDIKSDRRHMHVLEDFWLPRREGGRGTEIDTLPGGQNLGEMEDVLYFQKLFYQSLNIPVSRLDSDAGNNLSRGMEITRDELNFKKFINRIQRQFANLFLDILKTHLILKKIIKEDEWEDFENNVDFIWAEDSYFTEAKYNELMRERLSLVQEMEEYIGKYYSHDYVRRRVLKQTDEDIELIDQQIKDEESEGEDHEFDGEGGGSGPFPY